ncbi:protein of unknown function [Shewanella benthica]|uniref:Uncharacterized protein n=1 Tax=Shewanella benthica TaxID=43661 RepID=A0A330MF41_9GAMM|nr:protein of unknown function [Shewanella benthica]
MDSFEIKSRRLAEPSRNKECTTLAGQALGYNEGYRLKLELLKKAESKRKITECRCGCELPKKGLFGRAHTDVLAAFR